MNAIPAPPALTKPTADILRPPIGMDADAKFLRLSREIAMDIHPLEEILKRAEVSPAQWEFVRVNKRFQDLLAQQIEAWNSATNTQERVRIKSLSFVEEALPEFFSRAHDKNESLNSKVEILKTVSKFAGLDRSGSDGVDLGTRFSVTINLGTQTVKIDKELPSGVTIDHAPLNSELG